MNGKQMAADVLVAVKSYVERASRPLADRVLILETRAPVPGSQGEKGLQGERGEQGPAGKDGAAGLRGEPGAKGDPGDRGPIGLAGPQGERGERGERGEQGPTGKDGAAGIDGKEGPQGMPGSNGKDGAAGRDGRDGAAGINGRDGARGEKGDPGRDGRDVELEQVKALIAEILPEPVERVQAELSSWLETAVKAIPIPQDGAAGRDGKDFSIEEVRGVLEAELSKWELEFERRATAILQKSIDRMPIPADGKDGSDGKDGADGLGFDDFDVGYDEKRTFTFKWTAGDREKTKTYRIPVMLYAGVYKTGQGYEQGDVVTYGGSGWVATKDAPGTPGEPDSGWKLSVKRGGK